MPMQPCWSSVADASLKAGATLSVLWTILALLAVVLAAAVVIVGLARWAKQPPGGPLSAGAELSLFRSLYERGECSKEEYEQIREKLGQKLRRELQSKEPRPAEPPAPERGHDADADPSSTSP